MTPLTQQYCWLNDIPELMTLLSQRLRISDTDDSITLLTPWHPRLNYTISSIMLLTNYTSESMTFLAHGQFWLNDTNDSITPLPTPQLLKLLIQWHHRHFWLNNTTPLNETADSVTLLTQWHFLLNDFNGSMTCPNSMTPRLKDYMTLPTQWYPSFVAPPFSDTPD
jgi:hypothetical protein